LRKKKVWKLSKLGQKKQFEKKLCFTLEAIADIRFEVHHWKEHEKYNQEQKIETYEKF